MLTALANVAAISAVLPIVLAVARDVPILHLVLPRDTNGGFWVSITVIPIGLLVSAAGVYGKAALGGVPLYIYGFGVLLAYLWWCAVWHLRERR